MSFYTEQELLDLGFRHVGADVKVSRLASFHGRQNIEIGDHSRIDDFCVLSAGAGGIRLGRNVHIAVFSSLIGGGRIELHDFSGLSSRVSIYSSNDDYSGRHMTNPTVPTEFTHVIHAPVTVERHVIVGAGAVILPGVTLREGCGVGALSLVTRDCDAFTLYAGVPAKRTKTRLSGMLELERRMAGSAGQA